MFQIGRTEDALLGDWVGLAHLMHAAFGQPRKHSTAQTSKLSSRGVSRLPR